MTQDELNNIIQKLIALGEDAEELNLWKDIYADLDPEDQKELDENLTNELKELQASS